MTRFVDEDRVDLVHDREDVAALDHVLELELHVVAQVVEAEFVVGAVGDVAGVRGLALVVEQAVLDAPDRQPQELVDPAHPLGVAPGEVVVDGHDVDAAAGEGVQVDRHRPDERLAFARLHLGDLSRVEDHAADQLDVEGAHPEGPDRSLPGDGERFLEQFVEDGGPGGLEVLVVDPFEGFRDAGPELQGLGPQIVVREGLDGRLERVDALHARQHLLDVAFVLGAEDLGEEAVDHD
jgi:hypothetical protein